MIKKRLSKQFYAKSKGLKNTESKGLKNSDMIVTGQEKKKAHIKKSENI